MADNKGFDPKQLAEYESILENVESIITDIIEKDQNLAISNQAKVDRIRAETEAFQSLLELKFKEAEITGKALGNEERKNLLLQEYRSGLQDQLTKLTTTHHQNQQAIRQTQAEVKNLDEALTALNAAAVQDQQAIASATKSHEHAVRRLNTLKSQTVDIDETSREKIVNKLAAEMRYADAQLRSSQAAQSSMTMLLGLDNKWRQTLAGSLMETLSAASKARGVIQGLASTVAGLSTTLSNVGSFGNVAMSSVSKVVETTVTMVGQIDRADVSLRAATGASKTFATGLSKAFEDKEIREMAASYDELSQAQGALYSIARRYSGLSENQRLDMDRAAVAAKRFGIAFDTSAMVMDQSFRVFGIQGPDMLNRLYNSAVAIGETPTRMVQNFTQALDVMSQYSAPRAIQVLQGLSAIAKQTGIEMNTLTSIAARFDTFDDAASNVAKLNAIMGGAYFNSIQMLNASEEQRLYLLRAGLDATNRSWESLGRWEKKAFAAAAGFKNMNTAAAFFTGNMAKVDELTRSQERQAEMQGRMIMMGGQVVDVFQQITRVFQDAGFGAKKLVRWVRIVVSVMKDLGFKGIIAAKVAWSVANSIGAMVMQSKLLASAMPGATLGLRGMAGGLMSLLPLLGLATYAWMKFSDKMREEKSPPAYSLTGITAQGMAALAAAIVPATKGLQELQRAVDALNDKKLVSLSRTLGMISQLSGPDVNFKPVAVAVSELSRGINNLDVRKVDAFSNAMARLGFVMKSIPKENIVAVTQLTKESRMISALPVAAAARSAAAINAQGSAVRAARASEAPRGGGGGGGGTEGVLVTDSISVNVGGAVLTQKIQDVARTSFRRMQRRSAT